MEPQEDQIEDPEFWKREFEIFMTHNCKQIHQQRIFFAEFKRHFVMDSIRYKQFKWSKYPDFLQYVQALEEWDEIIGDKWTQPDSINLNSQYWIKKHPINNIFMHEISIERSNLKIRDFLKEFNECLNLIWRQENSEINQLQNPRLMYQSKIFSCTEECLQQYYNKQILDYSESIYKIFRNNQNKI